MATLTELQGLLSDDTLKNKVRAAALVAAMNILNEGGGVENHTNRLKWAKAVMFDPNGWADRITRFVVVRSKDEEAVDIPTQTDATIQSYVDSSINLFADGA